MNWNAPRASATVSWLPPMLPRGLERETVAPGSTAPEASATVPAMAPTPCAAAGCGRHITHAETTMMLTKRDPVIVKPLRYSAVVVAQLDRARGYTPRTGL